MKDTFKKLKRFFKKIINFLPTPLPIGVTQFEAWAADLISTYQAPDNDSIRFALATMILHLGPTVDKKAKHYFGKALNKAAANEVANYMMRDLKDKQAARQAAALKAASDEIKQ